MTKNRIIFGTFALALTGALFLSGCRCNVNRGTSTRGSPGFSPMAQTGPLDWTIDGKKIKIENTYYLALPKGVQYTIEYAVPPEIKLEGISDEEAFEIAFPLMAYAYKNNLHKKSKITKFGTGKVEPTLIGVALMKKEGIRTSGYRVSRPLQEVAKKLD